jgi:hypothetical protein
MLFLPGRWFTSIDVLLLFSLGTAAASFAAACESFAALVVQFRPGGVSDFCTFGCAML